MGCAKKQNYFFVISHPHFLAHGEMAEWSKAHAWKVCKRRKRF